MNIFILLALICLEVLAFERSSYLNDYSNKIWVQYLTAPLPAILMILIGLTIAFIYIEGVQ